jgi:hypothetical protein
VLILIIIHSKLRRYKSNGGPYPYLFFGKLNALHLALGGGFTYLNICLRDLLGAVFIIIVKCIVKFYGGLVIIEAIFYVLLNMLPNTIFERNEHNKDNQRSLQRKFWIKNGLNMQLLHRKGVNW